MDNRASFKEPWRRKSLLDNYRSLVIVTATLLIAISSFSQVRQGIRVKNQAKGFDFKEVGTDSLFRPPLVRLPLLLKDTGAISIDIDRKKILFFNKAGVWDTLAGSGTGGGEIVKPGFALLKVADTLYVDSAALEKTLYVDSNTLAGNGTLASPLYVIGGGGGSMDTLPLAHRGTPNTLSATNIFTANTDPLKITGTGGLNPKILTVNFDTYGSPIFQVNSGTPLLGHNSPALWIQNTNAGSSSMIGFYNNTGVYAGEIGTSNLDNTYHSMFNYPTEIGTFGSHPISDGTHLTWHNPLFHMVRSNGSIRFFDIPESTLSTDYKVKFDLANNQYMFGDTSSVGAYIMQIKGDAALRAAGPQLSYLASGLSQPVTIGGALSANLAGRVGVNVSTTGGLLMQGFTSGDNSGIRVQGHVGATTVTQPAILFEGYKSDGGTGRTALGAAEPLYQLLNNATTVMDIKGNGDITHGALKLTQTSDAFLSSNNTLGIHSNGYTYFQGNTNGFIIGNNNQRFEQLQLRSVEHSFYLFTNNTERIRIDSNGVIVLNNLVGTGKRSVTTTSNGQLSTGYGIEVVNTSATSYTIGAGDGYIFLSGGTTCTLTLPNPATYPNRSIKVRNGNSGTATFSGYSIFFLTGSPSRTTLLPDQSIEFVSDATQWVQIGANFIGS